MGEFRIFLLLNFRFSSILHLSARGTGKFISIHCTIRSIPNPFLMYHLSNFFRVIQIMSHFICTLQISSCAFYLLCCSIINPFKLAKTKSKKKFSLRSPMSQRALIISVPVLCNFKATPLTLAGNNSFATKIFEKVQTSSLSENATNKPGETL